MIYASRWRSAGAAFAISDFMFKIVCYVDNCFSFLLSEFKIKNTLRYNNSKIDYLFQQTSWLFYVIFRKIKAWNCLESTFNNANFHDEKQGDFDLVETKNYVQNSLWNLGDGPPPWKPIGAMLLKSIIYYIQYLEILYILMGLKYKTKTWIYCRPECLESLELFFLFDCFLFEYGDQFLNTFISKVWQIICNELQMVLIFQGLSWACHNWRKNFSNL